MCPRTETFDPPLVRIQIAKARFPDICPVCGKEAQATTKVTFTKKRGREVRPYWDTLASRSYNKRKTETGTLLIPTCEEHYHTNEGDTNYRFLCTLGNGILFSILFVSLLLAGSTIWDGGPVPSYLLGLVLIFSLTLGFTVLLFRSPELLRAVRVVGFDMDFKHAWLSFESDAYRMKFMEKNRMNAELVRWIRRV